MLSPSPDAGAAAYGTYTEPDGAEYRIEVVRWTSNDAADSYTYADSALEWTHEATVGRFFLACRLDSDTDANNCVELLTSSSAVEAADVEGAGETVTPEGAPGRIDALTGGGTVLPRLPTSIYPHGASISR